MYVTGMQGNKNCEALGCGYKRIKKTFLRVGRTRLWYRRPFGPRAADDERRWQPGRAAPAIYMWQPAPTKTCGAAPSLAHECAATMALTASSARRTVPSTATRARGRANAESTAPRGGTPLLPSRRRHSSSKPHFSRIRDEAN
jgi:hypothetical protein